MKSDIDPNVGIADCCATCAHRFEVHEYDCGTAFYCCEDGPRPNPCGSIAMGEGFGGRRGYNEKEWDKQFEAWEEWARSREVQAFNVCDNYVRGEGNE